MTPQDRLIEIIKQNQTLQFWAYASFKQQLEALATAILKEFVHKDEIEVDEIELANEILAHSYHDTEEADKLAHALAASKSKWLKIERSIRWV